MPIDIVLLLLFLATQEQYNTDIRNPWNVLKTKLTLKHYTYTSVQFYYVKKEKESDYKRTMMVVFFLCVTITANAIANETLTVYPNFETMQIMHEHQISSM